MLRPCLAATVLCLLAVPAVASDVVITLTNNGSDIVRGVNSFPYGRDGEIVDDNIGGMFEDVSPGASTSFTLSGDCGNVRFYVRLASLEAAGKDDLTLDVDTCTDRTIVVSD